MSLRSMTGYGRGSASGHGIRVETELSSVNRKQVEVRLNLPRSLAALESRLVELIQGSISRGQVAGGVTVHAVGTLKQTGLRVDGGLASSYVTELRATARRLGLDDDLSASLLLQLPGVIHYSSVEDDADAVWPILERALKIALRELVAMRRKEGAALGRDIARRLGILGKHLDVVKTVAPGVTARYCEALAKRLEGAGLSIKVDDPAVVKELAVFADRSDISEEITRLDSHLKQAAGLLRKSEPAGRTLDFLAQEMFREINTIGSKANDIHITREVISFKTELERIREQVQNVE